MGKVENGGEPVLLIPLSNGITKAQELGLARVIVYHPEERTEWWTSLIGWAERSMPTDTSKESLQLMERWIVFAGYFECVMDCFRAPEQRWFADLIHDGKANMMDVYMRLRTLGKWNPDLVPEVPPLFLHHLHRVEKHPVIAITAASPFGINDRAIYRSPLTNVVFSLIPSDCVS
ncbi:hypothetical protein ACFLUS_01690 [Chloroflexota bacterium]